MRQLFLSILCSVAVASAADNMKAFPPADAGMTRYVLPLPPQADETALKVELIVGKTVNSDTGRFIFTAVCAILLIALGIGLIMGGSKY